MAGEASKAKLRTPQLKAGTGKVRLRRILSLGKRNRVDCPQNLMTILALIGALACSALTLLSGDAAQAASRGYSIPTIDLANDKDRQVVVDKEAGQYLGHPTTVLLEDGKTILCVYPKGHGRGQIVLKRSTDGGSTWSERLPVPDNWSTSLETPTIHRVVDSTGKKRLILFSGLYPIRMSVSEDDGRTWSPLRKIGDFGGIVAMADLVRLRDGRYMAVFHDDGRFISAKPGPLSFKVYKTLSADGGLSWSPRR